MAIGLNPLDLDQDRSLVLVDMRPPAERVSELGFIPGSLLQPLAELTPPALRDFAEKMAHLSSDGPIVLTCVSGHRSGNAVRALEPLLGPTRHLEGGLLGWGAAGYPLCFPEPVAVPGGRAPSETDFDRAFRSAFLGELIQCSLDGEELGLPAIDTLDAWQQLYAATGLPLPTAGAARRHPAEKARELIDRAGARLRLHGATAGQLVHFMEPLYSATLTG
jgi:rhodanese-related sulfurtransferase